MFGFSKIKSISTEELAQKMIQKNVKLLDVREVQEYKRGHIKGSINYPLGQLDSFIAPAGSKIFVICQSGARSKRAYKMLEKKGMDVTNVTGGMLAWKGKIS